MEKINILFVHQSAELYGSDKILLALASQLDKSKYNPIVFLPGHGPLTSELDAIKVEYHILPITKLSRATLSFRGLWRLTTSVIKSMKAFNRVLTGKRIDIVHSNTLAVLSGALWARAHKVKHIWHIHEIIQQPVFVRKAYSYLIDTLSDRVICVSKATLDNLLIDKPAISNKAEVIWNGIDRPDIVNQPRVSELRSLCGLKEKETLIALVGRINRWKGQMILVDAITKLWQRNIRNVRVVIVGSTVVGQEYFLDTLKKAIFASPAKHNITLLPYTNDVWSVWNACDIAIIPSTDPEPFGLVALEAMAASKAVVAANHGGLAEIVNDKETGLLVKPGDAVNLSLAIETLATDDFYRLEAGKKGFRRYQEYFTLDIYTKNMVKVYEALLC